MTDTPTVHGTEARRVVPTRLEEVSGRAAGVTVLAFFALAWTGWGTGEILTGAAQPTIMIIAALASVTLATVAWRGYRRAAPGRSEAAPAVSTAPLTPAGSLDAAVPNAIGSPERDHAGAASVGRRFGLIVAVEWIGLLALAIALGATGHAHAIAAVVCLGVGLHFFPLARLFHVREYVLTGVAMCVLAAAAFIFAPLTSTPSLWTAVPGVGSAIVLYATCVPLLQWRAARATTDR